MNDNERALADIQREASLQKLSKQLTELMLEEGWFRTCYNCEHWIEGPPDNLQQICGKYKQRPPTKIIVCGCEDHSDNIPY